MPPLDGEMKTLEFIDDVANICAEKKGRRQQILLSNTAFRNVLSVVTKMEKNNKTFQHRHLGTCMFGSKKVCNHTFPCNPEYTNTKFKVRKRCLLKDSVRSFDEQV